MDIIIIEYVSCVRHNCVLYFRLMTLQCRLNPCRVLQPFDSTAGNYQRVVLFVVPTEMKQKLADRLFCAQTNQNSYCTSEVCGSAQYTDRQMGLCKKYFLKVKQPQNHPVKTLLKSLRLKAEENNCDKPIAEPTKVLKLEQNIEFICYGKNYNAFIALGNSFHTLLYLTF